MDLFYGRIIPYLIAGLFILILGVAVWIARRALRLEQDLLGLNRNLENCVAERTREIVAANEQLALKNEAVSALNEELTAQNEEIQAMNDEIESLNHNLATANDKLEQRIAERTADLTAANEELAAQYSELVETQARLEQERSMTDAVFDIVPGALYLYDEQGNPVRWNRQIGKATGFSEEELSRMKLLDWFEGDPESYQRAATELVKVFRDGSATLEANLRTRAGGRIPFRLSAVSLTIGEKLYFKRAPPQFFDGVLSPL